MVNLLFMGLIGIQPSAADLNNLVGALDSGAFTQIELAIAAAEDPLNLDNIGLVGLAEAGLEFTPV